MQLQATYFCGRPIDLFIEFFYSLNKLQGQTKNNKLFSTFNTRPELFDLFINIFIIAYCLNK